MAIEKQVKVAIGVEEEKQISVRLSLRVVDTDSGEVLSNQYHRMAVEPGAGLAELRQAVEAHIAKPGGGVPGAPWPKIPDAEWSEVEAHVGVAHKPAVVAAYKARQAAGKKA